MTEREEIAAYLRERMASVLNDADVSDPHMAAMNFAVAKTLSGMAHNIENGFYKEKTK